MEWKEIKSQKDIDELLEFYFCFHDACIVSVTYNSGISVDKERTMHFSGPDGHQARIIFQSQQELSTIELCFTGVRRIHIVGAQNRYMPEIFDTHLAFHEEVFLGDTQRSIVWADTEYFDIEELRQIDMLDEPADNYIIANELKWRIIEKSLEEQI